MAVSLAALFTGASALQGRPAVVVFHNALLSGLDATDALARLDSMETGVGATPDAIYFMELLWAHITGHAEAAHACSKQIAANVALA